MIFGTTRYGFGVLSVAEKTRTKVYADTVLVNFPLFCPKCKKELKIDIVQLNMVISK